ncbi:MAG: DNA polymerase/3'-5' exonuclease PolX [Sumerlaeia bacterium]
MPPLNRRRLAESFNEMAVLLQIAGANSFKTAAFEKAAQTILDENHDVQAALEDNALTELPSIGKGIADKIKEFAKEGTFAELEELREKYPPSLVTMTTVPGFGAKKAKAVFEELGIATLDGLEAAAKAGELDGLKGFGKKTVENILKGIETVKAGSGRFRLDKAREAAEPLLDMLKGHPAVIRAEAAGSLRRWKETVHDIDFVCATGKPEEVMKAFTGFMTVERVLAKGKTKSSVVLSDGIQADLRCVTEVQYPFALAHFTGSKEHNIRMRQRANARGLVLNEYGLFPEGEEKTGESKPAGSEADLHKLLGLKQWVAPELREDMGECDAAEAGELPELIEEGDIRGLLHMHTHYSDGQPRVRDYAEWAAKNGIAWMGLADHSQSAGYAGGLSPDRVREQWAEIDAVNAEFTKQGIRLLKGIESDIRKDGSLDYDDDLLAGFDFVVASVHSVFNLPEAEQTDRIIRAVRSPFTTVLGHMTGRLLLRRDGYDLDQKAVIAACAEEGVAIEINANPMRLDMDWRLVKYALEKGAMLSIGPDAHKISGLAHTAYGVRMARKGWAVKDKVVNCWDVETFLEFAGKRRAKAAK